MEFVEDLDECDISLIAASVDHIININSIASSLSPRAPSRTSSPSVSRSVTPNPTKSPKKSRKRGRQPGTVIPASKRVEKTNNTKRNPIIIENMETFSLLCIFFVYNCVYCMSTHCVYEFLNIDDQII